MNPITAASRWRSEHLGEVDPGRSGFVPGGLHGLAVPKQGRAADHLCVVRQAGIRGQRVRRREDPRFITGHGQYVDDLEIEGALHVSFVRSEWAHARIGEIDSSALDGQAGVEVVTAADLDLRRLPSRLRDNAAHLMLPYL